ncbi:MULTISPECIES: hypothetical protein [Streptomycetaceae]|uniref:Uncharacterized protein n=1 Tax=Streptantibioticus cattleyicolor (strain ATCC 35852 / DSM 46488 / JCM 4925 / NBRC 14057 / NRRL 8057) TaxID=1003195 RepID=F8JT45_STREN|nr:MULTISPECIES: hypothetical protein [Streptomycetaceae]AEW92984.1 hypothetical protein SCATT_06130 [Streptantibioticus cattleyicolor NRRL 8057 = DSM 46488]MYS57724.1 hypothetical protein [Streptomyces sp. SID5468]CCB73343.1 protein of unknown function [Streptantibioticus cattleyicolor NRRL 8057 = DSM 46488]
MTVKPVNHRTVLNLLHPLQRVISIATVNGRHETVRIGELVVTCSLSKTFRYDAYDGVTITVINPAVGILDVNAFRFADYGVTTGTSEKHSLTLITPATAASLADGVGMTEMEQAIRRYLSDFTGIDL